ncbi:MAG TPA: sigma-70 family RNA polymerase sigma factor [Methylomirabilota bacterium]|nr:sigma-70 family RNA polymerase sigma factor [Methylomirabilota bacterium]
MPMEADDALTTAYSRGSEEAFNALVRRHVDMVFATAVRQVGDHGLAEEVTQNVFIALARKAPGLKAHATLAGWLYRTTLLEAKAKIRAELRRKDREEKGARLADLQTKGQTPAEALLPLLDEGLMQLREGDRLALIVRFFEERSLREVGERLGVDEEAARKRVSRAIDKLTAFFQKHGFIANGGSAAVLTAAVSAAPASLASAVTQSALASTASASCLGGIVTHFMALTKTQTAMVCAVLAAAPVVWNRHSTAAVRAQESQIQTVLQAAQADVDSLSAALRGLEVEAERLRRQENVAQQRLAKARAAASNGAELRSAWDDSSPLMRVPKAMLQGMPITPLYPGLTQITPNMKMALQLTDAEAGRLEDAANRLLMEYHGLQMKKMQAVEPTASELDDRSKEDVRVFELPGLTAEVATLRTNFLAEISTAIGGDRAKLFQQELDDWMPMKDEPMGLNTGMAIINTPHRAAFYKPEPGAKQLKRRITTSMGLMNYWVDADRVPSPFQPHLQDWIQVALTPEPQ